MDDEIRRFLTEGTRTGMVAFTARNGQPLVAPVWFVVEDEDLVFNTSKTTAKARAFARDPRVTVCVDMPEPPYAFVQVQGEVTLSEDPGGLLRTATVIAARYMGADLAEQYGRRNGAPGELVVRLRPTKVVPVFDMTA